MAQRQGNNCTEALDYPKRSKIRPCLWFHTGIKGNLLSFAFLNLLLTKKSTY